MGNLPVDVEPTATVLCCIPDDCFETSSRWIATVNDLLRKPALEQDCPHRVAASAIGVRTLLSGILPAGVDAVIAGHVVPVLLAIAVNAVGVLVA